MMLRCPALTSLHINLVTASRPPVTVPKWRTSASRSTQPTVLQGTDRPNLRSHFSRRHARRADTQWHIRSINSPIGSAAMSAAEKPSFVSAL